jgi:purine nucleoside transport protein
VLLNFESTQFFSFSSVNRKISGLPKMESFFSIQMMFLGNTEALAVIRQQMTKLKEYRLLTFGIMSISSISGSIIGAYLTMVPANWESK